MMFDWIMLCFRICDRIVLYNFVTNRIMLMVCHGVMSMMSHGIVLYGVFVVRRWDLMIRKCIWRGEWF